MQEAGVCGGAGGNPEHGGAHDDFCLSEQEAWRLHQDVKHQSNHDQCVSDLSGFVYLGEIILASVYRIDFIGSGASLKADQEVSRFCIILTNRR